MADRADKCAEHIVANIACATQLEELRDENSDTYRTMVLNVVSGIRSHYPDDRELLEAVRELANYLQDVRMFRLSTDDRDAFTEILGRHFPAIERRG